ncbi:MAG: hypothetical protein AABX38_03250 [Candidatus Micrarchaeota archaeon]
MSHLITLNRDQSGKIRPRYSSKTEITSERDFGRLNLDPFSCWDPRKKVSVVPLYLDSVPIRAKDKTPDFELLPSHLRSILSEGILRTSGSRRTDYSVLMVHNTDHDCPEGRTGAILYKGEPTIVSIESKEFVVEAKGVGSYDGNNRRTKSMVRSCGSEQSVDLCGSMPQEEGKTEFENLEILRLARMGLFAQGDMPRAVQLITYATDVEYGYHSDRTNQSYLVRLSPGTQRASFRQNEAFELDDPIKIAESVARNLAQLLMLPSVLTPAIHPENLVRLSGGNYGITDLADATSLYNFDDPKGYYVKQAVLTRFFETPGLNPEAKLTFAKVLVESLGLRFDPQEDLNLSLYRRYFAPRYYAVKKTLLDIDEEIDSISGMIKRDQESSSHAFILRLVKGSLEKEIDFLSDMNDDDARKRVLKLKENLVKIDAILQNPSALAEFKDGEFCRQFYQ